MPTLHAQIAVSQHLVDYVSSSNKKLPLSDKEFSCNHVSSGADDMKGVRIVDNLCTIVASGQYDFIALDLDMAAFDSCCIYKNFRKPMLDALKEMDPGYLYGKDKIPWSSMVEYGFGEGYIHNTYWDAGRKPLFCLNEKGLKNIDYVKKSLNLYEKVVGKEQNLNLSRFKGVSISHDITLYCTDDPIPKKFESLFTVTTVMDGSDLYILSSEGSGEKTTLCANSITNLSLQKRLFKDFSLCKFGRSVKHVINKAIGDDISIIMQITNYDFSSEDIEEFLSLIKSRLELYGFEISLPKTCFLPRQSEFVQTYAIRGLYIPKDQIMTIPSEKPRTIDEPQAFMESMKRLYLSKVSRGCSVSL